MSDFISQNTHVNALHNDSSWVLLNPIERSIKEKIENLGIPLKEWDIQINYGVKTGFNEAFIIDGDKREELIKQDAKSADIIRPILRGRDIRKYSHEFANLYIITTFPSLKIDIEQYPAVKQHLNSFGYDRLKQTGELGSRKKTTNKWFETQDSISYWDDFFKQKIIWGEISDTAKFGIELSGEFVCEATSFLLTGESLQYLTCFLNSKLSAYLFSKIGTTTGVGTIRWKKYTIEQLLVPKLTEEKEKVFIDILNKILIEKIPNQKEELQNHLDDLIFEETKLSPEEIHYIKFEATI